MDSLSDRGILIAVRIGETRTGASGRASTPIRQRFDHHGYFHEWRSKQKNPEWHLVSLAGTLYRLQTMDLRIARIALVTDSTLLSRNLRDFRKVPGLIVEDWTHEAPTE